MATLTSDLPHTHRQGPAPVRVVLFDGVCNLCNGFVQFIIRRDRHARYRFGALQSPEALALLAHTGMDQGPMDTIVYLRDDRLLTRSTAALTILKDLGGVWSLLYAFIIVPPFLRDPVYGFIARNRYRWFGKRDSCMLPTPELRARFLSA
jgi:predicted DCC family thiol-disulfide oxidoreductase YuxK